MFPQTPGPIGLFDSGYGGLTIFDKIHQLMPGYDYVYLGDNARSPYGTRSFEVVYQFTRQAVSRLFESGCQLVILACNTASAKALRTIQQKDLPTWDPNRRVLGVIRPTVELVDTISRTKHIGIVGTSGTITSNSYTIEIGRMYPHIQVTGEACPMWVPLVENIRAFLPSGITLFSQGEHVAESLRDYLGRHPEMDRKLTKGGSCRFLTTESAEKFSEAASIFMNTPVSVSQIEL